GEADIPAVRLFADRDGLRRPFQGATPTHGYPPDLGEKEEAIVQCRAVAILLVGERVVARPHPAKERLIGLLQPCHHILRGMAMDGGVLWHGGANVLYFRRLLVLRKRDAAPLPCCDASLQGHVVEMAAQTKDTSKFPLLLRCGIEFVLERFARRS